MELSLLLLAVLIVGVAAVIDARTREVPHWVVAALLAVAAIHAAWVSGAAGWHRFGTGLLVGLAVPALLYFVGGLGAGDVKLLAALGAMLGPWSILSALIYTGLFAGVLSAYALSRGQRTFAYVPAIALGLALHVIASQGWGYAILG